RGKGDGHDRKGGRHLSRCGRPRYRLIAIRQWRTRHSESVVGADGRHEWLRDHRQRGHDLRASRYGHAGDRPGQDAAEVGGARPTTVDRLVAAIRGELSREELAADLQCAVNAVAVMDACYASDKSGAWENVVDV
ncbi:MAG: hypothetical protein VX255_13495, partial [Candidatus Latescibacterota bacterium]|nr:hypothetical protein [Candidatus Latescibacterota bacterium]